MAIIAQWIALLPDSSALITAGVERMAFTPTQINAGQPGIDVASWTKSRFTHVHSIIEVRTHQPKESQISMKFVTPLASVYTPQSCQNYLATQDCSNGYSNAHEPTHRHAHPHTHADTHTHTDTHTYAYTHARTHASTHTCTHTHTHAYMHARTLP